ncbi:putative F-box domain-containing protein [Tanacetum coccineum]
MAEVVVFDAVEQILVRLESKDLIRFKTVCKSWHSLISSPSFVKAHLNFTRNKDIYNNNLGHRRIVMLKIFINMSKYDKGRCYNIYEGWGYYNKWEIVGASNGLRLGNCGRRPLLPKDVTFAFWSCFGYDSSTDDYKVVMGIRKPLDGPIVQALSLKSNTWKLFGQVKYRFYHNQPGIFFNGALYWFVFDANNKTENKPLIVSFNLSKEEFVEVSQPDHIQYKWDYGNTLGIVEDSLCIFSPRDHPRGTWVLRNYNVKQSWELLSNDYEMPDDVAHSMNMFIHRISRKKNRRTFFCDDDTHSSRTGKYIGAPIFVQSLVSPYLNGRPNHKNDTPVSSKIMRALEQLIMEARKGSGKRSCEQKNPITATD